MCQPSQSGAMCSLPHGGSCVSLFYHTYINILCNKIHLEISQAKCRCRRTITVRLWWILTCWRWEMPVEGSMLLENAPRWRTTHCPCILYCPYPVSCGQVAELHLAKALCHCATAESPCARPICVQTMGHAGTRSLHDTLYSKS